MAQTHLKSFNGRQGGILQSISGVSGASGGLKSQNFDFLTQKFKMAQNGSNSSQNGSNSSQTQNGSNSSQTHLKNSKWLKMAQTHLKIFDFLTQKFKMAQTHLKSFNGRQGGILQSISGVSGASGGLKSQNFDFLTQKFKMAVFTRFHFLKSKNPISGHN